MSLLSRNVYIVKNEKMLLGCMKARPITVLGFKHLQHAQLVKHLILKKDFIVTRDNSCYILQSYPTKHNEKNELIEVDETPENYIIFLAKVNSLHYSLVSDIIVANKSTIKFVIEQPKESPVISDEILRGNLKKIFYNS